MLHRTHRTLFHVTTALNIILPVLPGEGDLVVCGPGDGVDDLLAVVKVPGGDARVARCKIIWQHKQGCQNQEKVPRGLEQDGRGRAAGGGGARHRGRVHVDEGVGAARLGVSGKLI